MKLLGVNPLLCKNSGELGTRHWLTRQGLSLQRVQILKHASPRPVAKTRPQWAKLRGITSGLQPDVLRLTHLIKKRPGQKTQEQLA